LEFWDICFLLDLSRCWRAGGRGAWCSPCDALAVPVHGGAEAWSCPAYLGLGLSLRIPSSAYRRRSYAEEGSGTATSGARGDALSPPPIAERS
jgi:hypothetical protein